MPLIVVEPETGTKPPIYFVTVIGTKKDGSRRDRCWGWYSDPVKAEADILVNATDMFECGYYDYAVIEEVKEGLCQFPVATQWFFADYEKATEELCHLPQPEVSKIEPPEWSKGLVGWCF